jgi:two-component sensor histidine kinase
VRRSERLVQFFLVLAREGRERADAGWAPLRTIVEEAIDDEGPGFPGPGEDARPRGYGLGLTLARRLCETQGWELRTGRAPTGGARVTIVFPDSAVRRHPIAD